MRWTAPLLLLLPALLSADAPSGPLTATAQDLSPTPSPTPDTRVRMLADSLRWQPDPKHSVLRVEVTQIGVKEADPEVHITVTDPTPLSDNAKVIYDNSLGGAVYLGSQALPLATMEHDLLFAVEGESQEHYLALTWVNGQVLEALSQFTKERPEVLQGKDAEYLLFNVLDTDTYGSDIYRASPGKEYECVLHCVPFAQRFDALNQFLRQHDAFIEGQSISPCGPDHP